MLLNHSTKLLAIDMDGTLLNSDRRVSERNRAALNRAANAGIRIVLASGRIGFNLRRFQSDLNLDQHPMIASNGAEIYGPGGVPLQLETLSVQVKEAVAHLCYSAPLHLNGYTQELLIFSSKDEYGDLYLSRVGEATPVYYSQEEFIAAPLFKALIVAHPSEIQRLAANDALQIQQLGAEITLSEPDYIEFLPSGVSKGSSLKKLADHYGFPADNVAAIGDYFNDLEMLQFAGQSAAMASAPKEVLAAAKYTAPPNDEDGVAWFIDTLLDS